MTHRKASKRRIHGKGSAITLFGLERKNLLLNSESDALIV